MARNRLANAIYAELAERLGWAWDASVARYRSFVAGRFVSEATVRATGERFVSQSIESNIENITERFLDGKIDLATWQQRMAAELKDAHIVNACIGRGGRAQMTFSDWGRVGARLREQYRYLNRFAEEIKNGLLSNAQISQRALMYARSARISYYDGLTSAKAMAEFTEEQRVLGYAEHCTDCPDLAGYWAPIGSLPPIGMTQCLTNCKCTKIYRKFVTDEKGVTTEVIG